MREITFKVYRYEELKGSARERALETLSEYYLIHETDFSLDEIVESARKAAEFFSMKLFDWSIGVYDRSYAYVDVSGYMELDNASKNDLVAWIGEIYA